MNDRDRRDGNASPLVLSEDEALEIIALLVTAARTQLDESAEYAPLRMLAAVGRLAGFIAERVTPETRAFLAGPLQHMPDAAFRTADPARYAADLDLVCRAVADHLVRHFGLDSHAT